MMPKTPLLSRQCDRPVKTSQISHHIYNEEIHCFSVNLTLFVASGRNDVFSSAFLMVVKCCETHAYNLAAAGYYIPGALDSRLLILNAAAAWNGAANLQH